MAQQWLSADFISFTDPFEIDVWNGYLTILKSSHVRITNDDDTLVWNLSKSCRYSPKEGYAQFMRKDLEPIWWWKVLWKLKCPLKSKLFCWFILSGKVLTWDVFLLKGCEGPGRCYLCKMECESNFHIGVECPFTQSVWLLIEDHFKLNNISNGDSVNACFKNWFLNMDVASFKPLAIIVFWFIWKAINLSCFEDLSLSPAQVCSFSLGMMKNIPQK